MVKLFLNLIPGLLLVGFLIPILIKIYLKEWKFRFGYREAKKMPLNYDEIELRNWVRKTWCLGGIMIGTLLILNYFDALP